MRGMKNDGETMMKKKNNEATQDTYNIIIGKSLKKTNSFCGGPKIVYKSGTA